ncbi:hypothetical protein BDB00DRAFT_221334 [Zychaea mexicana]|uniref:uncharacterized protein n=1 Tax=Zychaea mexicana TaxID=64656 RepID=UPI0022FE4C04|nr:uncharacterized protein BDB00DRAFT_221334 [Zychaea mexicana]KAI9499163.1 hypothetical protein BDB00DRAFT_221334 [Zychaea mexicana]
MVTNNTQILFQQVPGKTYVPGQDLAAAQSTIDLHAPLQEGEFILKNLVLSVDPYMRLYMATGALQPGNIMAGNTMSVVLRSNNPDFQKDDLVYGLIAKGRFEQYSLVTAEYAKIAYQVRNQPKQTGLPLSNYVGVLGMAGMTAYAGLLKVGKPVAGETILISAASGAVGQLVGQMAKNLGLRVVGSAGSDAKIRYLVDELGFDGAFNYKTDDIDAKLTELCPKGIDIYFDNVGGLMLEKAIDHANHFARIPVCGAITQYDDLKTGYPVSNLHQIMSKAITIQGFHFTQYVDELETEFLDNVAKWLKDGSIKYAETVSNGIETMPQALLDVLNGKTFGKGIVKVADL